MRPPYGDGVLEFQGAAAQGRDELVQSGQNQPSGRLKLQRLRRVNNVI
jgi:hypothetical protein